MKNIICIAGKNSIAVNVLQFCLNKYGKDENFEIVAVLTKNDDGINSWQPSFKYFCEKKKVQIISLEEAYSIDNVLFLSVEFDRIVETSRFLSEKIFNIHFSLLPKYKGMYPSVFPILHGERKTGVTLHRIRHGIDTGEIIAQEEIDIEENDSSFDLYNKLTKVGIKIVTSYVDKLLSGDYKCNMQSAIGSTYYPPEVIDYHNLRLETKRTAYQIKKQVLAFAFRPYQLLTFNGYGLIDAQITSDVSNKRPGEVIEENELCIKIATIDYDIVLYKDVLEQVLDYISIGDNCKAMSMCISRKIINAQDEAGKTPLIVAVCNNNFAMVEYLVQHGADVNMTSFDQTDLLAYAKKSYDQYGDDTILNYICEVMPLNKQGL